MRRGSTQHFSKYSTTRRTISARASHKVKHCEPTETAGEESTEGATPVFQDATRAVDAARRPRSQIFSAYAPGRHYGQLTAKHMSVSRKKTGQICWREKHSVSDLELSSLAGFFAFIWSNLCTRNIQKKITPRGHHDWPDKRAIRGSALSSEPVRTARHPSGPSSVPLTVVIEPIVGARPPTVILPLCCALRRRPGQPCGRQRRHSRRGPGNWLWGAHRTATRAERSTVEHRPMHLLGPCATHQARAGYRRGLNAPFHEFNNPIGG
jgi:hypothetical protein